jgi:ribonuclease T1
VIRRWRRPQLALIALILAVGIGYGVDALHTHSSTPASRSGATTSATVELSALPPEVAQTVTLIEHGGPYPYTQDGVVFDNNEHLLPAEKRGYYHEYTVPTPGADSRATRRIVTGADGEYYYTGDHYESFERMELHQ